MSKSYEDMTLTELRMEYERQERRYMNSFDDDLVGPPPEFVETKLAEDIWHEIELRQKYESQPEFSNKALPLALTALLHLLAQKQHTSRIQIQELELFGCLALGLPFVSGNKNALRNVRNEWSKNEALQQESEKELAMILRQIEKSSIDFKISKDLEHWLRQSGNS